MVNIVLDALVDLLLKKGDWVSDKQVSHMLGQHLINS